LGAAAAVALLEADKVLPPTEDGSGSPDENYAGVRAPGSADRPLQRQRLTAGHVEGLADVGALDDREVISS
jgi:hypothetical protein